MRKILAGILTLLCFYACTEPEVRSQEVEFYDLQKELHREAAANHERGLGIVKVIERGGKQEQKIFQKPDWPAELKPFMDCDLNKPAYRDAYTVSKQSANDTTFITYTAKEKKLPVHQLKLAFYNNELSGMQAEVSRSNSYFSLHEDLSYIPGVSYSIIGRQRTVLAGENNYSITSRFAFIK